MKTVLLMLMLATVAAGADEAAKPKVAVFPLGGNAKQELREKCAFSLRAKLDREGHFDVVDGYTMKDLVEGSNETIEMKTPAAAVMKLAASEKAVVLIWGELANGDGGATMRLNVLDLREKEPRPRTIQKLIAQPTDLRFVAEEILETVPGVAKFEHPNEEAVQHDATAEELWKRNPNLVTNGDFLQPGHWNAIYQSEYYPVEISSSLPEVDKVCIYRLLGTKGEKANNVLAMNLSPTCAANNGMACLSDAIKIDPNTRYRFSFRYKSDGPVLHIFIKGYTTAEDIKGKKTMREIYRRQVPVTGATGGKWVDVVDELNPQHVVFPVETLRVDLYAYLGAGRVMFDDIVLKAVGKQNRVAKDEAIKAPVTRPASAK